MTWHILGGGSLGCLWAARLQLAGQPVRLILRPAALERFQAGANQLLFTDLQQQQHALTLPAENATASPPIQRLIVATKAHAAACAVADIRHRLHPNSQIMLLQNGIGSQQEVAALVPDLQVIIASSTEGAWLQAPFNCVHAGNGHTQMGSLHSHGTAPDWLATLQQADIACQWQHAILPVLWRKLAINCLINPLTVIHQCRNGELAQHAEHINLLAAELQHLLQAVGQSEAAQDLPTTALQVIHNTAANHSSMWQDTQQGRRTEISYITGFALQQCQLQGLNCPQLTALHRQLQQHLRQRGLPDH